MATTSKSLTSPLKVSKRKPINLARFFDEFALAGRGLLLASRKKTFWPPFVLTFLLFGTLINLLSAGFTSFQLIGSCLGDCDFSGALQILTRAFLNVFGVGRDFLDFALNLILTLFQAILLSLAIFIYRHNQKTKRAQANPPAAAESSASLESSAIVAGLAVLGSGCPTCGTTLLAPLLGTLLSGTSSAVAIAGTLSSALNALAILLAILVFRKLGLQTYAIIKSEEFKEKHHEENR